MPKDKKVELEEYTEQFVPVFPTEKNPYHEQGKKVMIHPDMAKFFIQKGMMTDEFPEGYIDEEEENQE